MRRCSVPDARVETHLDGSQTLHILHFRVEWDMFGRYVVRDAHETLGSFMYQSEAIQEAQRLAAEVLNDA